MKKILSSFIVGILALGISVVGHAQSIPVEEVGRFDRFVWEEEIVLPGAGNYYTIPIDTSDYEQLIFSIEEFTDFPFRVNVWVETKLFEEDDFHLTRHGWSHTNTNELKSQMYLDHYASRQMISVSGVETRLRIINGGHTEIRFKLSAALVKPSSAGVSGGGGGDDNDQCKEDILDLQGEMSMLRQQLAEANLYLDQLKWKELKRQEKIEKRKQKRLDRKDKKSHKDHDDD